MVFSTNTCQRYDKAMIAGMVAIVYAASSASVSRDSASVPMYLARILPNTSSRNGSIKYRLKEASPMATRMRGALTARALSNKNTSNADRPKMPKVAALRISTLSCNGDIVPTVYAKTPVTKHRNAPNPADRGLIFFFIEDHRDKHTKQKLYAHAGQRIAQWLHAGKHGVVSFFHVENIPCQQHEHDRYIIAFRIPEKPQTQHHPGIEP